MKNSNVLIGQIVKLNEGYLGINKIMKLKRGRINGDNQSTDFSSTQRII